MTLPELPALPHQFNRDARHLAHEARERILVAEIERLRALWMAAEERAGHAEEAALSHAEKIERLRAEREALRSVLSRFDERWLMDGELGFCVVCGNSIEGGEAHKPDCWLSEAIDAARGKE